jgi:hypothetical protein
MNRPVRVELRIQRFAAATRVLRRGAPHQRRSAVSSCLCAPMLASLPGGRCHCPHWGGMLKGRMTASYADRKEVFRSRRRVLHALWAHGVSAVLGRERAPAIPQKLPLHVKERPAHAIMPKGGRCVCRSHRHNPAEAATICQVWAFDEIVFIPISDDLGELDRLEAVLDETPTRSLQALTSSRVGSMARVRVARKDPLRSSRGTSSSRGSTGCRRRHTRS